MVDRPIVYPGEIMSDSTLLGGWKDAIYGIGHLAQALLGTSTLVGGLAISPTGPASLQVVIGTGSIYTLEAADAAAYGSLGTDSNQVVKQGLLEAPQTLTITPPTTSGFSQVFLVEAVYADTDGGATVLPYFNSANPALPLSGPGNSGSTQNTVRAGVCNVALKAGTAATTGTQTAPSPDAGFVPLYLITVANGATQITSANIAVSPTAPFIPFTIPQIANAIQQQVGNYAVDHGSANALAITLPTGTALTAGMPLRIKKIASANTGAITIAINGGSAISAVWDDGSAFAAGDWPASAVGEGIYDGAVIRMNGPLGPTVFARTAGTGSVTVGSTAIASGTSHGVLLDSTGILGNTGAGTAAQVLTSNGPSADPTFQAIPSPIAPVVTIETASSGTFTTPTSGGKLPLYLAVEMIGDGSGGGGAGTTTTGGAGGAGSGTTFGTSLLSCQGGPATPTSAGTTYPTPATASGSTDVISGALGGPTEEANNNDSSGGAGAGTCYGSGAPGGIATAGVAIVLPVAAIAPGSGGGGGAITANTVAFTGWGGNAGAFLIAIITAPNSTYPFTVGQGGVAGTAGTSGSAGSAGAKGRIKITAHFQ